MKLNEDFVPATANEAITEIVDYGLSPEDLDFIRSNDSVTVHMSAGMSLRNSWSLWEKDTPLQKDFQKRFKLFGHADDISGIILEGVWAIVKGEDLETVLKNKADSMRQHWLKHRVDPLTGEDM